VITTASTRPRRPRSPRALPKPVARDVRLGNRLTGTRWHHPLQATPSRQKCPISFHSITMITQARTGRALLRATTVRWRSRGNSTVAYSRTPPGNPLSDNRQLQPLIPSVTRSATSLWRHSLHTAMRRQRTRKYGSPCCRNSTCPLNTLRNMRCTCTLKSNMSPARLSPLIHTIRESRTCVRRASSVTNS
jgi:hypothetical protein